MIIMMVNNDQELLTVREFKPKNRRIMGGGGPGDDDDEEEDKEDMNKWPRWLRPLLKTSFFVQCKLHADAHKSECNMYCLDCMNGALCSLCLSFHKDHRAIQKYMDITGVQTYIINSARIVFLNERPQPRPGKGVTNTCLVCERSLLDSFTFCSLGCKSFQKRKMRKEMEGSDAESLNGGIHRSSKKTQSFTPSTPPPTAVSYRTTKRRKGVPHRSPMGGFLIEY
ncbi:PLATZ transcription factor family protein [Melia azedarach]|uniref:PLATZ transcription factor family protein n=1 Tax=Melia azedarach TaxID=155640 RepID=A0ACC1YB23_MELAZ|nr:PLATZ transcription factor family protein [Melia azedarach]